MTADFCSGDWASPWQAARTSGALKTAPPGMGRSPMRAGRAAALLAVPPNAAVSPSTSRDSDPVSFSRWLNPSSPTTIRHRHSVSAEAADRSMFFAVPAAPAPNQSPVSADAANMAAHSGSFNLYSVSIAPKSIRTFASDGVFINVSTAKK